jgi:hypothetical protein
MKNIFASVIFLFCLTSIHAQDASAISSANEIVWYGLDFSKAKFVGNVGSKMDVIKNKHMQSWNHLVASEPDNFPLKKELDKEIFYDLRPVNEANAKTDVTAMESFNKVSTDFENSKLAEMVSSYSAGEKTSGVGLVFIVTCLDKLEENSTVYAVFFDIASHKILASKKFTGEVNGVGFRNYWAGSWKNIIKKMDKKYPTWK